MSIRKIHWEDIRDKIKLIDTTFAALVDQLSPGKKYPIYQVFYPYGAMKGDTVSPFIPLADGTWCRLSDPRVPSDIIKHLGYGANSSPFGMIVDKCFEYFISIDNGSKIIPWSIYKPGAIFPLGRFFDARDVRVYSPNGVMSVSAGVRSCFSLANIGCEKNFRTIKRELDISTNAPKKLVQHWNLFKLFANKPELNCEWTASLIYFSEEWFNKLMHDPAWQPLYTYLLKKGWVQSDYIRSRTYYDIVFSEAQKARSLKPNPYLADTARHLFDIALGISPGFEPATNETLLPLKTIQDTLVNLYRLDKYAPTIIQANHYTFEEAKAPIYYSLKYPTTISYSPSSRNSSSTMYELNELEHLLNTYKIELSGASSLCKDTVMSQLAEKINFQYYHNSQAPNKIIAPSKLIADIDKRFLGKSKKILAEDGKFFRGCVSISV
jgi:hypothetical protein